MLRFIVLTNKILMEISPIIVQWITVIITPLLAFITTIFVIYQTTIQNTRLKTQTGIIADMKTFIDSFNVQKLKEANNYILEGLTAKSEEEKKEIHRSYREIIEEKSQTLSRSADEFNRVLNDLNTTDQKLTETTNELIRTRSDLKAEKELNTNYVDGSAELLNLSVQLITRFLPKENWNEFAKSNTNIVYHNLHVALENYNMNSIEVPENSAIDNLLNEWFDRHYKKGSITASSFGTSRLVGKVIKSTVISKNRNQYSQNSESELAKYQSDIKKFDKSGD